MKQNHVGRLQAFLLLVLVALSGTACSEKQKLGGRVTFPDGAPLEYGTIYFATDTFLARGILGLGGKYDVGSHGENDGLPPGEYKVYIVGAVAEGIGESLEAAPAEAVGDDDAPVPAEPKTRPATAGMTLLIDPKYTRVETTPLHFTIPGEKTFDFIVERASK